MTTESKRKRVNEYARVWRKNNPDKVKKANAKYEATKGRATSRARYLRVTYGLTPGAFDALLQGQDGRCAICKTDRPNAFGWCVDHDHKSGDVRGILCHSCNTALGHFKEDTHTMARAIAYVAAK